MQNNNIDYLRNSIEKISRFNHFSRIINLIISCLLVINTLLAFSKVIEFETFLIIFLSLEIIYYLLKLTQNHLIGNIDKSEQLKELVEKCSNFSKEELDELRLEQLEESTEDK